MSVWAICRKPTILPELRKETVALRDDCLGFTLARDFDPREIGLLYYVMASSQTLGEDASRTPS
jgi:hypothetical protein